MAEKQTERKTQRVSDMRKETPTENTHTHTEIEREGERERAGGGIQSQRPS